MIDMFPYAPTCVLILLLALDRKIKIREPLLRTISGCIALLLVWDFFYPLHLNVPQAVGHPLKFALSLLTIGGAFFLLTSTRRAQR